MQTDYVGRKKTADDLIHCIHKTQIILWKAHNIKGMGGAWQKKRTKASITYMYIKLKLYLSHA